MRKRIIHKAPHKGSISPYLIKKAFREIRGKSPKEKFKELGRRKPYTSIGITRNK